MKNICFCIQMHEPYRLKRYRFFDIGQDHYYYDDAETEEHLNWLVERSYLPLCKTLLEMIHLSKGKFHCGLAISGTILEMFEQFAPEMIDVLKELAATKCVEFLATPYSYSLVAEWNENDFRDQLEQHSQVVHDLFGQVPTTVCNAELLYSDEIALNLQKWGYKTAMTEGAKHILSWKSPNYVYKAASTSKLNVLMRNSSWSDELAFHFSDTNWVNYPMDAEKYAKQLMSGDAKEQVINIWLGAETFGIRQPMESGILEFIKALPYYVLENGMGFVTPAEATKKVSEAEVIAVPFAISWAGEAKDLSLYFGNDLQQEAAKKLYNVAERVKLCTDKRLKRDWLLLQDVNYFHYMNHADQGATYYESAYDAFINYMNVLADFLQLVEEQYPTTIENEELNSLLKTINNQEKEIQQLQKQLRETKEVAKSSKSSKSSKGAK